MKCCTKCGEHKPLDMFFARKGAADGRMSSCKACKTATTYAWRGKNREALNAYQREYATRPNAQATAAAWAARPDVKERQRELAKLRNQCPERRAAKSQAEKSNPRIRSYRLAYRKRADVRERQRIYNQIPAVKAARAAKVRKRRADNPMLRLNMRMSNGIGQAIRKGHRSWRTMVDYTCAELMDHLERQFLPGMSWDNFGDWHIDHIIPIASFNFASPDDEEFKVCWALSNLRPLWKKENLSKSDKVLFLI